MAGTSAEYAQIATYLRGRFRTLASEDDHAYAPLFTLPAGPTREEFMAASTLPDAVTKFLFQLDVKIDAILSGMQTSSLEHDFPYEMEILRLGAGGFEFTSSAPLAPGDWLETVVTFRYPGLSTASGIGRVTGRRVEEDGTPVFSFLFSRIQEEEREKIIRYVFKEERRLLRETRLE